MKGYEDHHLPRCAGKVVGRKVYLYPGDYHFATEPTLIHTVLGSCVSVAFFDRNHHYGALCHAVLDTNPHPKDTVAACSKYMDCVIDEMIGRFASLGVSSLSLETKIFGGARMLEHTSTFSAVSQPGARNISMARKILQEYGCLIKNEDCGGIQGRKIYFCSHTGDVFLKRIPKTVL